jgi:hypothetical protein
MQKIWADEPPKSKPWVLSTSTASISMPSQELGKNLKNSGVKAPKTVSSEGKGEREAKPLPPRARVQGGHSAQGSGSSRQGSVSSKRGSVTGAQKKGTWRLPEPESSFEDLEAVVPVGFPSLRLWSRCLRYTTCRMPQQRSRRNVPLRILMRSILRPRSRKSGPLKMVRLLIL